jgi:hypothetical protein
MEKNEEMGIENAVLTVKIENVVIRATLANLPFTNL